MFFTPIGLLNFMESTYFTQALRGFFLLSIAGVFKHKLISFISIFVTLIIYRFVFQVRTASYSRNIRKSFTINAI